jgi:hypothetical protein
MHPDMLIMKKQNNTRMIKRFIAHLSFNQVIFKHWIALPQVFSNLIAIRHTQCQPRKYNTQFRPYMKRKKAAGEI